MRTAIALVLSAATLVACSSSTSADEAAIQSLLRSSFDRPDARLDAGPVVVAGDSAVADWTQGPMGGRALLERRNGRWRIVLCSGEALRSERGLVQLGLHPAIARTLAGKLADAERTVAAERLSRMASFQGVVPMSEAAHP